MMSQAQAPPVAPPREEGASLRRLALLLKPFFGRLALSVLMLIALTGVNMCIPALLGLIFNDVFPNETSPTGNWGLLTLILVGIVAIYVVRNLLFFGSKYSAVAIGEHVCFTVRNRLFEHLQQMSLRFYRQNPPGRLSSRLMDDSFVIQSFIQDELPTLTQAVFRFLCLTAIIYAINWQLALASTIILPLHLAAYHRFRRPIKQASRVAAEQLSFVHGNLIEKFLGAEVVKGFTGEQRENEAFVRAIDQSRQSQLRSKKYHVTQKIVADLLVGVGTVALLGFGAAQVLKRNPEEAMKPGTFIMFFGYVGMLYPTVLELMTGFAKLTKATASVDRVFEMLDMGDVEADVEQSAAPPIRGQLQFKRVSFRYGEGERVLRDINFEILPGQVCAIVGPSGAGKSTLVNLVPRFNEPSAGAVELDGVDVRQIALRHLREHIGIAFQECFLFNSTIQENLRYAQPDATMRQIIEVAKRTGAHDFITRLPDGYQTIVGESGVSLSRGEKQRITLTRAMLKNPKILILDEATASIDQLSESQIIPAILDFMRGKTTLMVTHRPELLCHADLVLQIVDGQVVYLGAPENFSMEHFQGGSTPLRLTPAAQAAPDPAPLSAPVPEELDELSPSRPAARRRFGFPPGAGVLALLLGLSLSLLTDRRVQAADEANPATPPPAPAAQPAPAPAAPAAPAPAPASAGGQFYPLAQLNETEATELLDVLSAQLQAQHGYRPAENVPEGVSLPAVEGLRSPRLLARSEAQGQTLLQLGFKSYQSQPVHLWVYGATVGADGAVNANGDMPALQKLVEQAQKSRAERNASLTVADLKVQVVPLSYVEPDRCLALLKTLGYQTVEYQLGAKGPGGHQMINPSQKVDPASLPIVIAMPATDASALVGEKQAAGAFGLSMTPSLPSNLPNQTSSAPMMELMVLYHPAHPQQFAGLLDRIKASIDVPARQILIEAMVLEISETGLNKLGVEWELQTPRKNIASLSFGRLPDFPIGVTPTVDAAFRNVFGEFNVNIEALIRDGEAEILSRPSVLTLDNRQASIRVGEEVPVATGASGIRGGDRLEFKFQYIPIGILLNVRPRVSSDGEDVSMQIDGIVSAEVPGEDLVLVDSVGDELARAPRISTRRVQTYSRVANNTPFIIGGLVSKDTTKQTDKVPLLGDIPLLGAAFRSEQSTTLKREVIIVLTPYVLPEGQLVGRNLPKDEDTFDSFNNRLFRDAYRIRSEDVFDLAFLTENRQLQQLHMLANEVAAHNAGLAEVYPFDRFVGNRVPGERVLVYRQMYEVIKRREIENNIALNRLIFFRADANSEAGFRVGFLYRELLRQLDLPEPAQRRPGKADEPDPDTSAIFARLKERKQAIAMIWTLERYERDARDILAQPVPKIELIDCPDRSSWSRQLWELNQPNEAGKNRFAVVLQHPSDIVRLKRAVVVKRTVELNATDAKVLTLENFSIGRQLLVPTVKREKIYLVDEEAAKYFFYTEQYYPVVRQELDRDSEALRNALTDPAIRGLLSDPSLIDQPLSWEPLQ